MLIQLKRNGKKYKTLKTSVKSRKWLLNSYWFVEMASTNLTVEDDNFYDSKRILQAEKCVNLLS